MQINPAARNPYNPYKNIVRPEEKNRYNNAAAEKNFDQRDKHRYDTFEHVEDIDNYIYFNGKKYGYQKPSNTDKNTFILTDDEIGKFPAEHQKTPLQRFREAAGDYSICRKKNKDGTFSFSIRTGKHSVIMIDSEFLEKIANDPEMIEAYAKEIENMKRIDKQFERNAQRSGKKIISRGWCIDKDGGISSWSVVKTERKQGQLEKMNEYRKKLLKKKAKKKKEQQKLDEKRSRRKEELLRLEGKRKSALKERLKRKTKKAKIIDINDLTVKRSPKSYSSISFSSGHTPSLLLDKKV